MLDPLSLLPFALAARGGSIDGLGAGQLVAAGTTVLQRCAPLVRALAMGRTALLLPNGPAYLFALAASDGRGALLLDPADEPAEWAWQLEEANVRAIFTTAPLLRLLGPVVAARALVLVDALPASASVIVGGRELVVDLGSHHGLDLEGDGDAPGRDEECVLRYKRERDGPRRLVSYTHRVLLRDARAGSAAFTPTPDGEVNATSPWSAVPALTTACAALLAGARLRG